MNTKIIYLCAFLTLGLSFESNAKSCSVELINFEGDLKKAEFILNSKNYHLDSVHPDYSIAFERIISRVTEESTEVSSIDIIRKFRNSNRDLIESYGKFKTSHLELLNVLVDCE